MPLTFEKIASVTVGAGGAASIDFTSIPATYTDLVIKIAARATSTGGDNVSIQFNNDTGNNYVTRRLLTNNGTSAYSDTFTTLKIYGPELTNASNNASIFTNGEIYITNYTGSTQKSVSIDTANENNSTGTIGLGIIAGLWTGTSAITSIKLTPYQGASISFVQYSTATLYGISKS